MFRRALTTSLKISYSRRLNLLKSNKANNKLFLQSLTFQISKERRRGAVGGQQPPGNNNTNNNAQWVKSRAKSLNLINRFNKKSYISNKKS
jgi:hypothetical protein